MPWGASFDFNRFARVNCNRTDAQMAVDLKPGLDVNAALDRAIRGIPGVVGTGFFLHMADRVLEGDESFRMLAEHVRDRSGAERPAAASGPRGRQPR